MRPIAAPNPKYPTIHCRDREFKILFGLRPEQKWPNDGLGTRHIVTSQGETMSLWVNPKTDRSSQGVPRLIALCPCCSRTFGAGKIQQHYVACKARIEAAWVPA